MDKFLPAIPGYINDAVSSLGFFMPELVLTVGFLLVIIADLFLRRFRNAPYYITLITLFAAGFFTAGQLHSPAVYLFDRMLVCDHTGALFKLVFLLAGLIFVVFLENSRQFKEHAKGTGDACSILLALTLGMNLMAMSSNLLMIYITIEMVSIGSYLLVGYISRDTKQVEAAMKYVIFGSVCSAIMLYGLSLVYGFTGTLSLVGHDLVQGLAGVPSVASGVAVVLILIGIGFKLSAAPVHFWSPDVYEGAPTPVTAFLSAAPKAAGFAVIVRFMMPFQSDTPEAVWFLNNFNTILSVAAIASMIVGNFGALWQKNTKRMLAYSSIGHTGFLLMAVIAFASSGFKALIFYMFIYVIMNMAAFILVNETEELVGSEQAENYAGLGKHFPALMICFVIVLVSLTGLPPTAGFTAKFLVFSSALEMYYETGSFWILLLMITGAATTVVSLFYYFKIPLNAFLRSSDRQVSQVNYTPLIGLCVVLSGMLIVFLIFPEIITDFL